MTTVSHPPHVATSPASSASGAAAPAAGKQGGGLSTADAFAALLLSLAGGAGTAAPDSGAAGMAVQAEGEGEGEGETAAGPAKATVPADQALAAAPLGTLPVVAPFLQAAGRALATHAANDPDGGGKAAAPVAGAGPTAMRGKDKDAPGLPDLAAAATPAPAAAKAIPGALDTSLLAGLAAPRAHDSEPRAGRPEFTLPVGLQAGAAPAPSVAPDAPTVPVHQAALPSQPLDAAFAGDIAAEVKLMADNGLQRAELHLNPAELGPVRIELSVTAQTADISFSAAHATTREGIEQALPALRELLAGQGLQLGQAGVGSGGTGQQGFNWEAAREEGARRLASGGRPDAGGAAAGAVPTTVVVRRGQGMLDLYA